MKVICERRTGR